VIPINGRLHLELKDTDGDGKPDELKLSLKLGPVVVALISASALVYTLI